MRSGDTITPRPYVPAGFQRIERSDVVLHDRRAEDRQPEYDDSMWLPAIGVILILGAAAVCVFVA